MTKIVELPAIADAVPVAETPLRNSIMFPTINGATEIRDGTIFAQKLVVGSQTWAHNLTWTATDYNTASWSSGSIQFADGTVVAIDSGNTGNISATTYIYFDNTATLKTTTTYSDAIGDQKILLAIVAPAADSAARAVITALGAPGTTIDGNKIVTGKIQSTDGKTYFDLDNKEIIVNDGTYDRVHIGYQLNGY